MVHFWRRPVLLWLLHFFPWHDNFYFHFDAILHKIGLLVHFSHYFSIIFNWLPSHFLFFLFSFWFSLNTQNNSLDNLNKGKHPQHVFQSFFSMVTSIEEAGIKKTISIGFFFMKEIPKGVNLFSEESVFQSLWKSEQGIMNFSTQEWAPLAGWAFRKNHFCGDRCKKMKYFHESIEVWTHHFSFWFHSHTQQASEIFQCWV